MLFTARMAATTPPHAAADQDLVFVQYYTVQQPDSEDAQIADLTMQHLVWERKATKPHYAVISAASILQRVCICPHFKLWRKGKRNHFLLNDLVEQPVQLKTWDARSVFDGLV